MASGRWVGVLGWIVLVLVAVALAALGFGRLRWDRETRALRRRIDGARLDDGPATFDLRELDALPAPVQLYFRTALTAGQPIVRAVDLVQTGTMNMGAETPNWKPFRATQHVVTRRAGFDWDARIAMAPGVDAFVHDSFAAGEGMLHATVLGLATVASLRGGGDIARGELLRCFAETAWYPTALLPSQGVRWTAVDAHSADATMRDGTLELTLRFEFGDDGLIRTITADSRPRIVGTKQVPAPWQGRFSHHETHDGMRVPAEGEVAWILDGTPRVYWKGRVTRFRYTFAR